MSFFDNLENFHFLRPLWLLGLLVLPIIYIAMRKRALSNSDWSSAIDPALLKHLLPGNQQKIKQSRHFGMIAVLCFAFVAMAGPAWQEKPQEVVKLTDNMIVILDLSLSMLATDITPDRLTRSKQKLQDLLKLRKEGNTALIAFSGDSHVVTPLTDDTKTILANLPALDPFIMPVIGSRPDLAVKQAVELLKQGKANQGRIILLTDSVEAHHIERINETLAGTNTSLHVLAAGTAAGGPIKLPQKGYLKDEGSVVIPKTDFTSLATLAKQNRGQMLRMTLDDQDLDRLDIEGSLSLNQPQKDEPILEKGFDAWEDMGFLFVLFMIPLALRVHRQGVMLQASLLLSLFVLPVEDSVAFEWNDLWQTQDQQAQQLLDDGKLTEAAERFESLEHKANANYQAKNFELASEQYAQSESVNHFYNQGNALAQQQKFEEAIKSYEQAIEINPDNEDAQHNKSLIEEFMKQQPESSDQQNSDQNSDDKDQQNKDQQDKDQKSKDQKSKDQQNQDSQDSDDKNSKDQQDKSDQENKDEQSTDKNEDQQQESEQTQEEEQEQKNKEAQQAKSEEEKEAEKEKEAQASTMPKPENLTDEEKQSYEQWMRRVPDDPGGLLRRKFERQSRDRNRNTREAGEPIW